MRAASPPSTSARAQMRSRRPSAWSARRTAIRFSSRSSRGMSASATSRAPCRSIRCCARACCDCRARRLPCCRSSPLRDVRSRSRSRCVLPLGEPYHEQVREAAVAVREPDERRALHQRVAEIHEALPNPDPETLAYHYAQAGDLRRAAELSAQAARRASDALAFDRAALLYRNAISMTPGAVEGRLHVALGDALASGGRGRESADAYLTALDGAPPAEALELKCRAASQLLFG